jgi:prepilin-type N-terminal cleavage/methylation domain-containing protein
MIETATTMARRARARRAMTLLELTAVVMIMGLVAVMAVTRNSANTIADVSGQGFARRLALDCSQARRRAIATGDNHLVQLTILGGKATQYAVYRRTGGSTTLVDEVVTVPASVDVTPSTGDLEFTFTGEGLASYTITVQAPDRTWTVTVPQVTGKAFVQ